MRDERRHRRQGSILRLPGVKSQQLQDARSRTRRQLLHKTLQIPNLDGKVMMQPTIVSGRAGTISDHLRTLRGVAWHEE